jgi:BASS family bile acid:Na+ symporter
VFSCSPLLLKGGLQDRAHSARGQSRSGYNSDVKLAIFLESTQEPDEPEISIASDRVAITIFNTFLLPLVAGMLLCRFAPTIADKINEPLLRISGIALLLGVLVIIFNSWGMLLALGMPTFLAFAGFTVLSLAIGHLFGGPEHHMSLAIACATRHIGLALLVAAKVRGPKTLAMVAAYLIVSGVVSAFYIRFLRNRFRLHNF